MTTPALYRSVSRKNADLDRIARRIAGEPARLAELFAGLGEAAPRIKYGCAKVLQRLAEVQPKALYPNMDRLIKFLEHENTFLRCHAIRSIAELSRVDVRRKFERNFDRYFAPIAGPSLIPAVHAIESGATVALAKPELTERIVTEILSVRQARYRTTECRRVASGKAIESLGRFFDQVEDRERVLRFVRGQRRSSRASTRKKAERFLERHAKG